MKMNVQILVMAITGLFSCKQASKSPIATGDTETVNSIRKYEYVDAMGKQLIIDNSFPKSGGRYIDPNGKKYAYAVFWTRITNKTINPVDLKIDFPADSFELPSSSGNFMKLLLPSDTMTIAKEILYDYGLSINSFLDNGINKSYSLKRIIRPNESTAFYVVTLSNKGVDGALRSGLSLKDCNLFYKISAYKTVPQHPLMDEKEIHCGSINLKNVRLKK